MCLPKNKKGKPEKAPVKAASVRVTSSANKDASKKKISSAPAKGPDKPVPPPLEVITETSAKEKTCQTDKSDAMQISLYKNIKKKEGGSGSGPIVTKPADRDQDSPEVFENNAQVESLNPVNVTQIFVDSVIPQTNVSKQHTDIIDQNTLENVEPCMEDMIYDPLDSDEEQYPEVQQIRPRANVLQPEDDTILDTLSDRRSRPSDKRTMRKDHRPSTPDRLLQAYTPPPPTTKSEKVYHTGKRIPRGPLSTRTATVSRPRPSGGQTPQHVDDNTCPSHEQLTQRTHRPQQHSLAEYRHSTIQTAIPEPPPQGDNTCGSREVADSTATAKKTPGGTSNLYTAHMSVTERPRDPRDT